jgi:hypothetical protein
LSTNATNYANTVGANDTNFAKGVGTSLTNDLANYALISSLGTAAYSNAPVFASETALLAAGTSLTNDLANYALISALGTAAYSNANQFQQSNTTLTGYSTIPTNFMVLTNGANDIDFYTAAAYPLTLTQSGPTNTFGLNSLLTLMTNGNANALTNFILTSASTNGVQTNWLYGLTNTGGALVLTSNLPAAQLKGLVATANLGTGTANSSTFLRGDQTYATPGGGGTVTSITMAVDTLGLLTGWTPTTITGSGTFTPAFASFVMTNGQSGDTLTNLGVYGGFLASGGQTNLGSLTNSGNMTNGGNLVVVGNITAANLGSLTAGTNMQTSGVAPNVIMNLVTNPSISLSNVQGLLPISALPGAVVTNLDANLVNLLAGLNVTGALQATNLGATYQAEFFGSNNGATELGLYNLSTGTNASAGWLLYNANSQGYPPTNFYGEFGMNGSWFSNANNPPGLSNDLYIIGVGNSTNGSVNPVNLWTWLFPTNSFATWSVGNGGTATNFSITSSSVNAFQNLNANGLTVTNGITNNSASGNTVAYFNSAKGLVSGAAYSGASVGTVTSGDGTVENTTITAGALTLASAAANTVLGNNSGSSAAPSYVNTLPQLNAVNVTNYSVSNLQYQITSAAPITSGSNWQVNVLTNVYRWLTLNTNLCITNVQNLQLNTMNYFDVYFRNTNTTTTYYLTFAGSPSLDGFSTPFAITNSTGDFWLHAAIYSTNWQTNDAHYVIASPNY